MKTELHEIDSDDMSTVPIPARSVVSTFDAPTRSERPEAKPAFVRGGRHLITTLFNMWATFSTAIAKRLDWYPKVEPYVGYGNGEYSRLICRTVYAPIHSRSGLVMRGIKGMLAVPAPHVRIRVCIDSVPVSTFQIGELEIYDKADPKRRLNGRDPFSDPSGYLDLLAERRLSPGIHQVSYQVRDRAAVRSRLFNVSSATRIGIISDVDDTIMITQAPSMWKAAYNLLLLNPRKRSSVPGMSVLYNKIADIFPDAPFIYLSTSPWNVERSISQFIEDQGYPPGPLLLRDLDPRPKTFVPSGVQHKLEFAEQLMADFPKMKFILLGDDGQKDPTTYATIARRYPGRILAMGIRQLSPRESSPLGSVSGLATTQPMPVTDAPVFTGTTGANLMKTMLPYLEGQR